MAINNTLQPGALQNIVSKATNNNYGTSQSFAPTPAADTSKLTLPPIVHSAIPPSAPTPQSMTQQLQGAQTALNSYTASHPAPLATGATIQQATAPKPLFSSPIASLPQNQNQQQAPTYSGALMGLQNRANTPTDAVQQSQKALYDAAQNGSAEVQRANQALADFKTGQAKIYSNIESTPIPLNFQQGRIGAIQRAAATEEQALTGQVSNALAGQGQQLSALSSNASNALTGQGQQITAQGQVASYTAPQLGQWGQTYYQPGYAGTSQQGGDMNGAMQQYAQLLATGQGSNIPSSITSNPVLNAQVLQMAQQINPNFNYNTAQGSANAQVQNTQTLGTAQTQGIAGVLQSLPAMQSANTAADGIKNTIVTYLQQNPSLNATDLVAGNKVQQWIDGKQLADPKYQTLFNYLNEYTNTLAPVLGVGGSPTNLKTEIAQSFINAAASGKSIAEVLNNMSSLASNKIVDLRNGASGGETSVPNTSSPQGISKNSNGTLSAVSF